MTDTLLDKCSRCGGDHARDDCRAGAGIFRVAKSIGLPLEAIGKDYEIIEQIGAGGMCRVYRARELRHGGREVAIKTLHYGEFANERQRADFERDLDFLKGLQHPHIVHVYDVGNISGELPYYVMQLVRGGSLEKHLDEFKDPYKAAQLVSTMARALHFCHSNERPVLHLDIKPGNILIGEEGQPYLTDFGVATHFVGDRQTRTRAGAGTPAYMSPEQVAGIGISPASDIYSLGVVLYELLTGSRPHAASTDSVLFKQIVEEPIAPPHRVARDLSDVCMTALAKDPKRRYPTARDFAEDLDRFSLGQQPALVAFSWRDRAQLWLKQSSLNMNLLVTVAFLVALLAAALWRIGTQAHELKDQSLHAMRYAVRAQATSQLLELRETADAVGSVAKENADLSAANLDAIRSNLHAPLMVDVLTVFDKDGNAIARSPNDPAIVGKKNYAYRDYFSSARDLALVNCSGTTIAMPHVSESDLKTEFPIVAPLCTKGGFNGLLLAMVAARPSFGSLALVERQPADWRDALLGVVIGPRDRDRDSQQGTGFLIVAHPRLEPGHPKEFQLPPAIRNFERAAVAHRLDSTGPPAELTIESATDPLTGDESLVAVAAIGGTGYFSLVELPIRSAVRPNSDLRRAVWWFGVAWTVALVAYWLAHPWWVRRQAQQRKRAPTSAA